MQVVAVLNPIAGEKMQEELEERISALQKELDRAHTEVGGRLFFATADVSHFCRIHADSCYVHPDPA